MYPYSFLICVFAISAAIVHVCGLVAPLGASVSSFVPVELSQFGVSAQYMLPSAVSGILALAFGFILFLLFRVVRLGLLLDTRRFF